jgi:hypothetical protein
MSKTFQDSYMEDPEKAIGLGCTLKRNMSHTIVGFVKGNTINPEGFYVVRHTRIQRFNGTIIETNEGFSLEPIRECIIDSGR